MQKVFPINIEEAFFRELSTVSNSQGTPKQIQIVDPEFSSVCPRTGLPDYGRVILRYIPDAVCVELKDWKLYLRDFYGVGVFHEDVTQRICDHFIRFVAPLSVDLTIDWGARGGIHTTTRLFYEDGEYRDAQRHKHHVFQYHANNWHNM